MSNIVQVAVDPSQDVQLVANIRIQPFGNISIYNLFLNPSLDVQLVANIRIYHSPYYSKILVDPSQDIQLVANIRIPNTIRKLS